MIIPKPIPLSFAVYIDEDTNDVSVTYSGFDSAFDAGQFAEEMVEQRFMGVGPSMTLH